MKRVLALDLSSHTGWAIDRPTGGEKPLSGVVDLPLDGDEYGRAFVAFEQFLCDAIAAHAPDAVAFEAPLMHRGSNFITTEQTVRLLFGLAAITELVAHRSGLMAYEVNVATVKRHFAGNGRATKADMMARCRQLGWEVKDHNAADACAVWDFVRHKLRASHLVAGPLMARSA